MAPIYFAEGITDSIWFQLILLPIGAVIGVVITHIIKQSKLTLHMGGHTYEAGHRTSHLMLYLRNKPLIHIVNLPGDTAYNLRATISYTENVTIDIPDISEHKTTGTMVSTNHLQWSNPESKRIKLLDTTDVQSNSFAAIRLLTKTSERKGYTVTGSSTIITARKRSFVLRVEGNNNVASQWDLTVINSGSSIEGLKVSIKKKKLSAKSKNRYFKLKKIGSSLLGTWS